MGNVHSLSSEGAVLAIGGIVVISGVVYYTCIRSSTTTHSQVNQSPPSNSNKKGKKKNSKKSPPLDEKADVFAPPPSNGKVSISPIVVGFPTVLPGQFDAESVASDEQPSKSKKSKKKKKGKGKDKPATASASSAESSTPVPPSKLKQKITPPSEPSTSKSALKSVPSIDTGTDGSWTRVESHNYKAIHAGGDQHKPGLSVTTETETGESSPVAERTDEDKDVRAGWSSSENRKTLAEKLLPKPRKTAVDDMLETPDYPALSRVMRVRPRPDEKPASGFSWGDYEDVRVDDGTEPGAAAATENDVDADGEGDQDDNDRWGVVKSKSRSRQHQNTSASQSQPASRQTQSSGEQTKRQRHNANKREAQKVAKAAAEADRLATLAKHKRELERIQMAEQFASGGRGKASKVSGGMKASVDANGKLVWE